MKLKFTSLLKLLSLLLIGVSAKAQYCTTNLYYSGCTNNYISTFSTSGGITNIQNMASGCSGTAGFNYYANQTHTATAGSTVFFKIINNPVNSENYKIWVDWDNNFSFDPGEQVYSGSIYFGDSVASSFTVPSTATLGQKRMRVRSSSYNTSFTGCSQESYGEAEDYNINVVSSTVCASLPVAGAAISPVASICSGSQFSVSLNGYTVSAGAVVQWQSKLSSAGSWTNIAGATNTTVNVSQTSASDYRAYVTCGTNSDTSTLVSISQLPFTQCYCSPNNGNPLVVYPSNYLTNVSLASTTLNSSNSTTANGYTLVPASPSSNTANLIPGDLYTFTASISYYVADVGFWIDYNQNGQFETSEKIPATINGNGTASASFVVPYSATAGTTGMRVSVSEYSIATSCASITWGEVEDYSITIVTLPACSGAPAAGIATAVSSACINTPFNLSVIGSTAALGLTFQWQNKLTTGGTWSDISGATTKNYLVASQASPTDYRLIVSCGSNQDTSLSVSVAQNPITQCYCSPTNGTTLVNYSATYISNVSIPGTTLNSSNTTTPANGYTLVPATPASNTATLNLGGYYVFNVSTSAYQNYLWIDFNQNGLFEQSEEIPLTVNTSTGTATASFTVPSTATPGITGMRVVGTSSTSSGSCGLFYYGDVEDYTVTLVQLPACSGTPTAGTTVSTSSSVCPNTPFTLSLTGNTAASGLTYQWQSKLSTASAWSDINGATNQIYVNSSQSAATEYRAVVSCSSSSDTSAAVTVSQNALSVCYCSPNNGTTFTSYGFNDITNVSIIGTTLNYSSTSTPANGYTLVPTTPSSNTASLIPGQTYIITCAINSNYSGNDIGLWIDFDQDGVFSSSEQIAFSLPSVIGIQTATFNVPSTAVSGATGMRVMSSYYYINSACNSVGSGEVEDYTVTIINAAACTGSPVAGTAGSTETTVCPNIPFTLYLTGTSAVTGLSYQWQSKLSTGSTWTNITGATGKYHTINSQASASDYRAIVYCGTTADTSSTTSVAENVFNICYCSPSNGNTYVYSPVNYITNVSIANTTLNSTSFSTPTNGYTLVPSTPSYNTATINPGLSYTFTATVNSYAFSVAMWIDYNQSGTFDPSEKIPVTIQPPGGSTTIATASFIVPLNATTGSTAMRVSVTDFGTITDPCISLYAGEIEDYTLDIVQLPACSGAPTAGSASSSLSNVCPNTSFTLSLNGNSQAAGLSYQWQKKVSSNNSWTNISGATTLQHVVSSQAVTTEYRAIVTCSTNADTSVSVIVTENPFNQCYCSPDNGTGLVDYPQNYITNVTIAGTTLNSSSWSTTVTGYTNVPSVPAYNTGSLTVGQTYTLTATITSWISDIRLWIDYNQSGSFDPSEAVTFTLNGSNSATASFTIPNNALGGITGMRIMASSGSILGPCTSFYAGEVEDYTITIASLCDAPVLQGPANITSSSATLSWSSVTGVPSYEYMLSQSATPPTGSGTFTTALTQTVTGLNDNSTYYFYVRSDCGSGTYSTWSSEQFSTYPTTVTDIDNDRFGFDLYPNPAKNNVTIKLNGKIGEHATVTVFDITGRLLLSVAVDKEELVLDMSRFAAGPYLVRYKDQLHQKTIQLTKQ